MPGAEDSGQQLGAKGKGKKGKAMEGDGRRWKAMEGDGRRERERQSPWQIASSASRRCGQYGHFGLVFVNVTEVQNESASGIG